MFTRFLELLEAIAQSVYSSAELLHITEKYSLTRRRSTIGSLFCRKKETDIVIMTEQGHRQSTAVKPAVAGPAPRA